MVTLNVLGLLGLSLISFFAFGMLLEGHLSARSSNRWSGIIDRARAQR